MPACPTCGEEAPERARFCPSCGAPLVSAAPPREDLRKVVTVLFSDLKGSTALGERLDSESLRQVMRRYFLTMEAILERHGGTVEKFIGDAIMAVFGVPSVREDDALRAVRAAGEMRDALSELNDQLEARWGVRLRVRTGVNTGEVIAGDPGRGHGFVTGDAVNTAARLEQAAQEDEILIGGDTHALVRDAVRVEPVEPLELKGKAEPVPAFRLLEVQPGAAGVSRRLDSELVGREAEVAALRAVHDRVVADQASALVTVLGPAGVGKSRLTAEFAAGLGEEATVLIGRCLPYGEGITFWPVREVVRAAAGITEDDGIDPRAGQARRAARHRRGGRGRRAADGGRARARRRRLLAGRDLLGAAPAARVPGRRAPARRGLRRHPLGRGDVPRPHRVPGRPRAVGPRS